LLKIIIKKYILNISIVRKKYFYDGFTPVSFCCFNKPISAKKKTIPNIINTQGLNPKPIFLKASKMSKIRAIAPLRVKMSPSIFILKFTFS
jgi:hypothetical protein